ncbi:alcohol dehydrogenase catalytic domain-containing protein [bacterium]|nr:alcohol dehydrogenase catalytic domain-containing protein [bacterium]
MGNYQSNCYVYYGPGDVRRETMAITCGPTDIVIRVDVCGRCGTDRRLFEHPHPNVRTPTVLGHELVGRVVEVGRDVPTLTQGIGYRAGQTLTREQLCPPIGQRVTVQSRIARMRDGLMLMRDPIQNLSFRIPAGFAQYMKIPADMIQAGSVLSVPDQVTDEEGALVEPAACALESIYATPHAVGVDAEGRHVIHSGIRRGGRTLIIGSGTLAMIYGALARAEQAAEIWFVVRSPDKANLLGQVLGDGPQVKVLPDYAGLPLPEKLKVEAGVAEEFGDLTGGELFDDVVLAAPSADGERLMFQLLNPDGYGVAACFAGLHQPLDQVMVDHLHYRMAKAVGTSGCSTRTMETILNWLAGGRLSMRGFTCPDHYTLQGDPAEFFQTKADGRKPMLYPWE